MKIVVCGSVKTNGQEMIKLAFQLKKQGHSVLSPDVVPFPHTHVPSQKTVDRHIYYKGIENGDLIIVVTKDHVGFETACEIGYSLAFKKPLVFTHMNEVDGVKSILDEGRAILISLSTLERGDWVDSVSKIVAVNGS